MGFTQQNLLNLQLSSLNGSNVSPESVSMLYAAKIIVLQGCDVETTLEHTGVMVAKGLSLTLATYYVAGDSNVTNCANKTGMSRISMNYLLSDETLRQKWIRLPDFTGKIQAIVLKSYRQQHGEPHALATNFAIQNFPQSLQQACCLWECCWQFKTTFSVQYMPHIIIVKSLQQSIFHSLCAVECFRFSQKPPNN